MTGTRDTRDTLTDQTGASTTTWNLDAAPTFSDGTHTLHFARIEAVTGSQDAQLAFGLNTDTTARDLTLRYNPGTQEVQLVDSATLALVSTDGIAPTVDNLVQVAGTAGADRLRIEASVAAAGLAVVFDARGGSDALDLDASPGPVTTVLEKTDAEGLSGVGPVAFRGIDTLRGATTTSDTLRDQTDAAAVTWQLDTDPTYSDGALALAFSAFETLVGGPGTDTFAVSGAQAATLVGGAGADVFQFGAGAVLTGAIDGGAGVDTLDEAAATTARQVTLSGAGQCGWLCRHRGRAQRWL